MKKFEKTQRRAVAEVIDLDQQPENSLRVRLSSEAQPDGHGTIFKIDGMDVSRLAKESGVYLGHSRQLSSSNLPVARLDNPEKGVDENGHAVLDADLVFDPSDPVSQIIEQKMRGGFLRSLSIVARINPDKVTVKEDIIVFEESELIGADIVSTGSNPDAVVIGRELGFNEDETELLKERLKESEQVEQRAGKVLSRANEQKLREAAEAILSVLDKANAEDDSERAHEADREPEQHVQDESDAPQDEEEVETRVAPEVSYIDELLNQINGN